MSLAGVDLNLLMALDALLSQRNVTRAAEQMYLGQPAMSAALARLRKQLGDPLLVREGRGFVLTTLAESLVEPVQEAVRAAEAVLGLREAFDPATSDRTFSILASDYVVLVFLRPLLAELADEAPRVRLNISPIGVWNEDSLRRGTTDLLIYPTDVSGGYADFPRTVLFEDRYILAADRDHPERLEDLDVARFSQLPYLALSATPPSLAELQLDFQGISRNTQVMTPSFTSVPLMLTGTRLVALVHERLAMAVAEVAHLQLVPAPVPLRPIVEAMYWNRRSTQEAGHRWLRHRFLEHARRMSPMGGGREVTTVRGDGAAGDEGADVGGSEDGDARHVVGHPEAPRGQALSAASNIAPASPS